MIALAGLVAFAAPAFTSVVAETSPGQGAGKQANLKLPPGITVQQTAAGPVPADSKGFTAYVFDKDKTPGQSACIGFCAKAWPPLVSDPTVKPPAGWGLITREDGSKQWTYKGKPLYRFDKWDEKPGDIRDNNVGGIWRVAAP